MTTITDEQIEQLRAEAATAGDAAMIEVCDRAIKGDDESRAECARVIADAKAQDETTSTEAYAVCDANGPISVRIPDEIFSGQWPMQAVAEWLAEHGAEAIESASTDLEDDLETCWDGWDDSEISEALESSGFTGRPIDESTGSSGLPQVVAGDWWVWTRTARED